MRLLVLADRNPSAGVAPLVESERPDVVVLLGDLDRFAVADLADVSVAKLGVYGNHCSGGYFAALGVTDMHRRVVEIDGVRFGGLEGCVAYKPAGLHLYTQQQVARLLEDFPRVDVMLTHCPPWGVNDQPGSDTHRGFTGLRDYVARTRPGWLLHGHTHPLDPVSRVDATEVRYVLGHQVVEVALP